ncbi:MAG: ribosome maturation factor RimM [Bdellovibrionales bacterium]
MGWVKQAHGIRGELFVQLYARKADWLSDLNNIFLLAPKETSLKSWEVEVCRPHKDGLILKVKGVNDRNLSETMKRTGVYIPEETLVADEDDGIYLKRVLDFEVIDPAGVILGKITGFATNGMQDLLRVQTPKGHEALIPFVEAFIVNIDFDKHQVKMDLPQGLIDLEEK